MTWISDHVLAVPAVPEPVRRLSGFTFGIYLVHPLVGKLLGTGWDVFAWPALLHAAAAWWLACLVVWSLRRASLTWHELSTRPVVGRRHAGPASAAGWREIEKRLRFKASRLADRLREHRT